jgi:RimJ/RimL family protein N-acetyltransferase
MKEGKPVSSDCRLLPFAELRSAAPKDLSDYCQRAKQLSLIWYRKSGEEWSLSEDIVTGFFCQAQREGLFPYLQWRRDPTLLEPADCVAIAQRGDANWFFAFIETKPVGWLVLEDIRFNSARMHFCLFYWVHRLKMTRRIATKVCAHLLSHTVPPGVDLWTLRAEVPTFNKRANRFCENIGFRLLGEIPDFTAKYGEEKRVGMRCWYLQLRDLEGKGER